MSKGKPRHNPDKPANLRGGWCSHCDEVDGELIRNYEGKRGCAICGGNPHNCIKVSLHKIASLSESQRNNQVSPRGVSINTKGNLYNPM